MKSKVGHYGTVISAPHSESSPVWQRTDTDPRFLLIGFQNAPQQIFVYIFLLLTVRILGTYGTVYIVFKLYKYSN